MKTDYHAKYYAYELTKRCSSETVEKFVQTLSKAQVQLNPHQIDAALFAFCSPLLKGAILSDEVGLGKSEPNKQKLNTYGESRKSALMDLITQRNSEFFDDEMNKLEKWAEDRKNSLEMEAKRNKMRKELFDSQDMADKQKEEQTSDKNEEIVDEQ